MAAVFRQAIEIARHIIAADHVEHCLAPLAIGDPLHLGDEILCLVVHRMGSAPFQRLRAFVVAAAGDDDGDVEQAGRK